jgi:hypothetical protein
MTDGTENKNDPPNPPPPGFKRFTGAKLVPPPAPISQSHDDEKFPVFLGVGIALSMLALITVVILSFTSAKKSAPPAASPAPAATPVSTTH